MGAYGLTFTTDPAAFLTSAGEHLAADPVCSTVVASVANRELAIGRESPSEAPYWYLTVYDAAGAVVGVAMRTHPEPPYPPYVLPMPEQAALELAAVLLDRGEGVGAVSGAMPTAEILAGEIARRTDGRVELDMAVRLYELADLVEPRSAPGSLVRATTADLDLVTAWLERFHPDADRQAGVEPREHPPRDRSLVSKRLEAGRYWLWRLPEGPVHLCALDPISYGVQRIPLVYTPPEHQGRGYAGAAVAELCRRIVAGGARGCLFADRDNPVSNRLYLRLGFVPVVDMVNLTVQPVAPMRREAAEPGTDP